MIEEWKEIPGHPKYEASSEGRLRNKKTKRLLNFSKKICGAGYYNSSLGGNADIMVHKAVALAFLGEQPTSKHQVNHKNRNRFDNRAENLEWLTAKENIQHAVKAGSFKKARMALAERSRGAQNVKAKLDDANVIEIRRLFSEKVYYKEILKMFGISQGTLSSIVLRKTWKHV